MARLRLHAATGELTDAIDDTTTTITSAEFADLPVVASPDYLPLILDPGQSAGAPEVVYVTAHTSASTTITATRGREQAHGAPAGRAHAAGTAWAQGPTAGEFIGDVNGTAHTVDTDPIVLNSRVITVELDDDITAFADGEENEITLVLAQGSSGGAWVSHTGILVSWEAGVPPTLSLTPGNYDMIRLTRIQAGQPHYIGRVEIADTTLALA